MNKSVAVVLAGCGVYDGSEINEVVLTLLALEENNLSYQCYAPDIEQMHVLNHHTGTELGESRNVLAEAARIVRGNVRKLEELDPDQHSALILTGGFGVAKNLSNFAVSGSQFEIFPKLIPIMKAFPDKGKPSGYMCIAPVLLPKVFDGIECTIGNDPETAGVIEELGGKHVETGVDGIAVDSRYHIVSTPAYMLAENLNQAKSGIDKMVSEIAALI